MINQVILWGHKLHSHTHSYIHYGFFNGFKHLGYKTLWLDNFDNISNIDFTNSLFITEGQVDEKIPIRDDCYYVIHNCDLKKYKSLNVKNLLILQVFTKDCLKRNEKELQKCIHYTKSTNDNEISCLYIPWATDLLPDEINNNISNLENILKIKSNNINFIGSHIVVWNNVMQFCKNNNINFNICGGFSNNVNTITNQQLIQESICAPSVQSEWQCEVGYIPCRIFKNISYGKIGLTNNEMVYELFDKKIIYDSNIDTLLKKGIAFEIKDDTYKKQILISLMENVRDNHTYLNRIKLLLDCLFDKV
jgi:hypothetical protein